MDATSHRQRLLSVGQKFLICGSSHPFRDNRDVRKEAERNSSPPASSTSKAIETVKKTNGVPLGRTADHQVK